jgi:hypothetical protein
MRKSQERKVKYPENLTLKKVLEWGDARAIAKIAGKSTCWVYMILRGQRPQTMDFQTAFLEFVEEKKKLSRQKEELRRRVNEVVGNE